MDDKALTAVSEACNSYLKYVFTEYLYKTSKDLHSDINGVGTHALKLFLTSGEFEDYNWKNAYCFSSLEFTDIFCSPACDLS